MAAQLSYENFIGWKSCHNVKPLHAGDDSPIKGSVMRKGLPCMSWPLQWRHNERHGASNHQHLDCLLNRLFRRTLKKTPKLRVTGLCEGNPPVTGGFLSQRVSYAENVSIWWRHHEPVPYPTCDVGEKPFTRSAAVSGMEVALVSSQTWTIVINVHTFWKRMQHIYSHK